ncbi:uncharacterized protein EAE97_002139 [Botrytis byssoidea]|uniref:Uncharacterized protein n=1 Tax=Botrytis byssoidea TaxID=139641 RepID=A0A9P5IQJ3_9HELO|nr:uncharacterized protein EAE97_002139 [Botrytis byssoidea]KAF7950587.1 hypothetical protein EAE97_002139 [Botrytis byssoidea]
MLGVLYFLGLNAENARGLHHLPRFLFFTWCDHMKTLEGFQTTYIPDSAARTGNDAVHAEKQTPETVFALKWIQIRIAEYNSVLITSIAIFALAGAAIFSDTIASAVWMSRFVFYVSMIFSFTAVCKAYQQTRMLLRISCCSDPAPRMRCQLGNVIAYLLIPVAFYAAMEFYSSSVLMYRSIEYNERIQAAV